MAIGPHLALFTFPRERLYSSPEGEGPALMGQVPGTQPLPAYFLSLATEYSQHYVLCFGLDSPSTKPLPK